MRQALSIILPLLTPALIYIYLKTRAGTPVGIAARNAPWIWLSAGGVALAAALLTTLALTSGGPTDSTYRPARFEDGRVISGDIEPREKAAEEKDAK